MKINSNNIYKEVIYIEKLPIPDKSCIIFIETTGLDKSSNIITLLSIAFNKDENGLIYQLLNYTDKEDLELLNLFNQFSHQFKQFITTGYWFEQFLIYRIRHNEICCSLSFSKKYRVNLTTLYNGSGINIKNQAKTSIEIFRKYIKSHSEEIRKQYLNYNYLHTKYFSNFFSDKG